MIAWHYTTGEKFYLIADEQLLRPAVAGISPGETPVVWFSVNQTFERSALKGIRDNGVLRTATIDEMWEKGRGLVRFGIEEKRLVPWPKLIKKARIGHETAAQLVEAARKMGANPKQWRGAMRPVSLQDLLVEVMNEDRQWQRVENPR